MKTIKQTYHIKASVSQVWKALVDPELIDDWGGGPATMDDKEGTEFKLWGGDIYGKNIEVIHEKKLVQEWFSGDWNEASTVTFILHANENETNVELLHENVPDKEAKDIADGWKEYYMNPLKDLVEDN